MARERANDILQAAGYPGYSEYEPPMPPPMERRKDENVPVVRIALIERELLHMKETQDELCSGMKQVQNDIGSIKLCMEKLVFSAQQRTDALDRLEFQQRQTVSDLADHIKREEEIFASAFKGKGTDIWTSTLDKAKMGATIFLCGFIMLGCLAGINKLFLNQTMVEVEKQALGH